MSQKETEKLFKETDLQFKETDRRFKETDRQFKDTDRKINKTIHLFESQWGKFVESLVNGNLIHILRSKGIDVHDTTQRRKGEHNGRQFEFDIIAKNGSEIVIVEVKSTLNVQVVKDFLDELSQVRDWLEEYKDFKLYGAVAFLTADEESPLFSERQGLFVIKATGDSAILVNKDDFRPKEW
ncbi:MAG: hypothetical protein IPO72_07495 [Saprospiraceae bacterium]|nr:hypothetical protein [Candidatus Vicinibacter affinis]MBK6823261.1 hypothetical protein [Candidatus Vicinibacter affinis]MBK7303583.1 hypothetical protein [Candidatus Vicinibacter affinis]MBK7696478.1 hypothetical protein [Candidatus Vicinibacter affinis]MBK7800563.1 hypothetical protein [Candidatus Vicinibacter affinis]